MYGTRASCLDLFSFCVLCCAVFFFIRTNAVFFIPKRERKTLSAFFFFYVLKLLGCFDTFVLAYTFQEIPINTTFLLMTYTPAVFSTHCVVCQLNFASRVIRDASGCIPWPMVFTFSLPDGYVRRNRCRFVFLCFAVGQDGGGGSVEDAVHRAALPVQIPRVSDGRGIVMKSSNQTP